MKVWEIKIKYLIFYNGGISAQGFSRTNYVPTFRESLPARAMISPNPTKGMIQIIDFNANNVEIYNSSGVLVLTQNVNNNQVDLSSLKAGQYILNFTDENKNQTSVHVMKK